MNGSRGPVPEWNQNSAIRRVFELLQRDPCTLVPQLTTEAIESLLSNVPKPDAVVIDPPLGTMDGLALDDFINILRLFVRKAGEKNTFLFVWIDAPNLCTLRQAYDRAGLYWCDSICAELVDEQGLALTAGLEGGGSSRTVYLLRTVKELKRGTFAQQRSSDAGAGIARIAGKSRGRLGMPQIPHEVAESFWPGVSDRVFLEVWPTRMSPRKGWTMFDEER
jgi:hypothetical protein